VVDNNSIHSSSLRRIFTSLHFTQRRINLLKP
jgi:hypothetical protein